MFRVLRVKFSVPSKTFLLGEYIALAGGPAVLLSHGPRFEVEFLKKKNSQKNENPFHPDSPAGIWIDIHEEIFESIDIQFTDPFAGRGGFGASTAQFLAVYLFVLHQNDLLKNGTDLNDMQKWAIVEDYRNLYEEEEIPPSGYDLLSQLCGGLQLIESQKNKLTALDWPFQDFDVAIYKTPHKVTTHTHLQNLNIENKTLEELRKSVVSFVEALQSKNLSGLLSSVERFTQIQTQAGLLAPETEKLLSALKKSAPEAIVRGCGALGADVLLVFKKKSTAAVNMASDLTKITEVTSWTVPGIEIVGSDTSKDKSV